MIITSEIQQLISQIESSGQLQPYFHQLLSGLIISCQASQKDREQLKNNVLSNSLSSSIDDLSNYPIVNGYAVSFDPLTQEKELLTHWYLYGFVVGKEVVTPQLCSKTLTHIHDLFKKCNMEFSKPETWIVDGNLTPILSRGFLEIYHDDLLAQLRQSLRVYLFYVILWGTPFLWTTFDRLGMKLPTGEESQGLPLHVDQNPAVHSEFRTIQGVLALVDCPVERGTFVAVPNSIQYFKEYEKFISPQYKGEYVLLPSDSGLYQNIYNKKQEIPLKAGDLVAWDSRTTHANSSNASLENRYVAYISTGMAREHEIEIVEKRKAAFLNGLGENYRDGYMHASKKPRFTSKEFIIKNRVTEKLNDLGLCLYGIKKYTDYK
jgi:hypothetical protein